MADPVGSGQGAPGGSEVAVKRDPLDDICESCGCHIGYGHKLFHLGNCGAAKCQKENKRTAPAGKAAKVKLANGKRGAQ